MELTPAQIARIDHSAAQWVISEYIESTALSDGGHYIMLDGDTLGDAHPTYAAAAMAITVYCNGR